VNRQHFIIGEPSECIEQIEGYAKIRYRSHRSSHELRDPDLEFVERSMRLFGEQAIPRFATQIGRRKRAFDFFSPVAGLLSLAL
jgi:hypothetical protein